MYKSASTLLVCIILLVLISHISAPGQPGPPDRLQERIRTLVQNKNYDIALTELRQRLEKNPLDVFSRSWQTIIYLTREDSLIKAGLPEDIFSFDSRYNFDLVLENIAYLRTANPGQNLASDLRQQALETYDNLFGTLEIKMKDSPAIGFYKAQVRIKFIAPFTLQPVQEKRLEDINRYFNNRNYIYFNKFDTTNNSFTYQLTGFPVLNQFEGEYTVFFPDSYDSLFFEFNDFTRAELPIPAVKFDSLQYDLPDDYLLLYFDNNLDVRVPVQHGMVLRKEYPDRQGFLIPARLENQIKIQKKQPWWEKAALWGGIGILSTWIYATAR